MDLLAKSFWQLNESTSVVECVVRRGTDSFPKEHDVRFDDPMAALPLAIRNLRFHDKLFHNIIRERRLAIHAYEKDSKSQGDKAR